MCAPSASVGLCVRLLAAVVCLPVLFSAAAAAAPPPLQLHVGCGSQLLDGHLNVDVERPYHTDAFVEVEGFTGSVQHVAQVAAAAAATASAANAARGGADKPFFMTMDVERTPWPFPDDSVAAIRMHHVLEHVGQAPSTFLAIVSEMYRVCVANCTIAVTVPHHLHPSFFTDPTHVRAVTMETFRLFSRLQLLRYPDSADSALGLRLGVDLRPESVHLQPTEEWRQLQPSFPPDDQLTADQLLQLQSDADVYGACVQQLTVIMRAVKPLVPADHPVVATFPHNRYTNAKVVVGYAPTLSEAPVVYVELADDACTSGFLVNVYIHIRVFTYSTHPDAGGAGGRSPRRSSTIHEPLAAMVSLQKFIGLPMAQDPTVAALRLEWVLSVGTVQFTDVQSRVWVHPRVGDVAAAALALLPPSADGWTSGRSA